MNVLCILYHVPFACAMNVYLMCKTGLYIARDLIGFQKLVLKSNGR